MHVHHLNILKNSWEYEIEIVFVWDLFRCIKPNHIQTPGKFDTELARRQLLCNGLMEIAELRREGYPVRIRYEDIVKR
jgi:myosin heavy subunit